MNARIFRFALAMGLGALSSPFAMPAAYAQDDLDVVWQLQASPALAFSLDSTLLVTGNQLRAAADGSALATYVVHPIGNGVAAAAISPDASYVALGIQGFNQNLDVYDALTGAPVRTRISAHDNGTTSVAFSPDGEMLASGGRDGTVKFWRLPDVALIRTIGGTVGYHPRVFAIAFSPDGASLAVGGQGGVSVFNVAAGALDRTLTDVEATSLAYSPDGELLASGHDAIDAEGQCSDCTIKIWNAADGTLVGTLPTTESNNNGVGSLAFSADSSVLAAGSGDRIFDGVVRLFRVADGALIDTFEQDGAYVTDVAYSPDGALFALSRSDALVVVARNPDANCAVALSPTSRTFDAAGGEGKIAVSAAAGCAWQPVADQPWVHVASGGSGGSGSIGYTVDANAGATRRATIAIGDKVHTIVERGSSGRAR
jgi:WD40 repeat protein